MQNENWALSSSNLIIARNCIKLIESEFGERLRLSDDTFLFKLGRYAKKTRSSRTLMMCSKLAVATGEDNLLEVADSMLKGKPAAEQTQNKASPTTPDKPAATNIANSSEKVSYRGKEYARYNQAGLEFKGLYRGQARYG